MTELRTDQKRILEDIQSKIVKPGSPLRTYLSLPTGTGKTVTTVHFLKDNHESGHFKRMMWLAHSVALVQQSLLCFEKEFGRSWVLKNTALWGAENTKLYLSDEVTTIPSYRFGDDGPMPRLLLGTSLSLGNDIQATAVSSRRRRLVAFKPQIIIIDEAHRGINGIIEDAFWNLLKNQWQRTHVIGLSATPKARGTKGGWSDDKVVNGMSFVDYVKQGILAAPVPYHIQDRGFKPIEFRSGTSDREGLLNFNEDKIVSDKKRNDAILKTYLENQSNFGKTIIYGVNIKHCRHLKKMFDREGITSYVITSHTQDVAQAINDFRQDRGPVVAITVRMFVEGIDIPDVKTVILARPVRSEVEFCQMVGRAARKVPGKDTFHLVDVIDTLANPAHQKYLYSSEKFLLKTQNSRMTVSQLKSLITSPQNEIFENNLQTLRYNDDEIFYKPLNGLRILKNQTFGVELEIGHPSYITGDGLSKAQWKKIANKIKKCLESAELIHDVAPVISEYCDLDKTNYSSWNIVYDGTCGFECVSPVLKGEEGFKEIVKALHHLNNDFLKENGLEINYQCGFHLNLGWNNFSDEMLRQLIRYYRAYEPAFNSLVSPSRVIQKDGMSNYYCRSLRESFSDEDLKTMSSKKLLKVLDDDDYLGRYSAINFQNRTGKGRRLEIRLHQGTIEAHKVTLWTALWMNVLFAVKAKSVEEMIAKCNIEQRVAMPSVAPESNIMGLCLQIGLSSHLGMVQKIRTRRFEVISSPHWKKVLGGDLKVQELLDHWNADFRIMNFKGLAPNKKNELVEKLILANDLQISPNALLKKIEQQTQMLVGVREGKVVCCAAIKPIAKKLEEGLLAAPLPSRKLRSSLESGSLEFGYVYRDPDLSRREDLDKVVTRLLKNKSETNLIGSVRDSNASAHSMVQRYGFKLVTKIQSPFGRNRGDLSIYCLH